MAQQIPDEYGSEDERIEMFVGAIPDLAPGESVAVGFSLLDQAHILTAEKTGYEHVFVKVNDPSWKALVAEEYDVGDGLSVEAAVADVVSLATERYIRFRIRPSDNVAIDELPTASR